MSSIQSVLQQMRVLSAQAGLAQPGEQVAAGEGGFGVALQRSLDAVSQAQTSAYAKAESFELGEPGIALNDVMLDIQKANVGLQQVLAVRNKLVAAYQEVFNLPA